MAESDQWDDILAERLKEDAAPAKRPAGDLSYLSSLAAGDVPKAPRPTAPSGWTAEGDGANAHAGSSPEMIVRELTQRLSPRDETRAIEILTGRARDGSGLGVAMVAILVTVVAAAGSFLWARSLQEGGGLMLADEFPPIEDIREELPGRSVSAVPSAETHPLAHRQDAPPVTEPASEISAESRPLPDRPDAPPVDETASQFAAETQKPRPARTPDAPALAATEGPVFSIANAPQAEPEDAPDAASIIAALAGPAFEMRE